MAVADEQWLPTLEELTVPELQITAPVWRAGAHHLGKYCDEQCKEFMLCIKETQDPRLCLNEGKEVTSCGFEFFGKVKHHCYDAFTDYWQCIDHSDKDMRFRNCRKTQAKYDACIKEKLGQDRPRVGYFSQVRLHSTSRPRHIEEPHKLPPRIPDPPADPDSMPCPETMKGKGAYW